MKTIRLIMILCSLTWLTSCNSDDGITDISPVAVEFGTGNIATLRTTTVAGETQWTQGDEIGIFMIAKDATTIAGDIKENADNRQYKADNNAATSGFSPVGNIIYYPQNGDQVDFIAYYPYKSPLSNYTYPVDVIDQSDASGIDVLYSNNAKGCDKTGGTVNLQFTHTLSKLNFTLTAGAGAPDLTDATITVSNLYRTADMDLANGSLSNLGSKGTVTANSSNYAIVIPQTTTGSKLTVTLPDNNKYEWDFPANTTFDTGKQHTYTITVAKTGITVTTGDITDWTGKDSNPTEGGAGYKVGDYYPDPKVVYSSPGVVQSGTAAVGIVFWVDPADSRHGKIMELDEAILAWGYHLTTTGASDMDNGLTNMARIKNSDPTFSASPTFARVDGKNGTAGATTYVSNAKGIWYLPAFNELKVLYNTYAIDKTAFINRLNAAGSVGFSIDYYDFYWSSTENSSVAAELVYFDDGSSAQTSKENNTHGHVRAIMAF